MRTLAMLALLALLPGCIQRAIWYQDARAADLLRREIATPDGPETWRLRAGGDSTPRVNRSRSELLPVARLGVDVKDLGREFAQARGLEVGQGVVVTRVSDGSAAALAGIGVNDVLRSIDGQPLVSKSQTEDVVRNSLHAGTPALITRQALVDVEGGWVLREDTLSVVPDSATIDTTASSAWDLETSEAVEKLTGMQAALLPAEYALPLLDLDAACVLVTDVEPGSPAYLAGLRAGDRIERLDGQPLETLEPLTRAVAGRALARNFRLPADARQLSGLKSRDTRPSLEVSGPLGDHTATLGVVEDLHDETDVHIPFLYDLESSARQSTWQVLFLIQLQIGPTYDSVYTTSETRQPEQIVNTSILPLRLLDYERHADGSEEVRFLWVIHWSL